MLYCDRAIELWGTELFLKSPFKYYSSTMFGWYILLTTMFVLACFLWGMGNLFGCSLIASGIDTEPPWAMLFADDLVLCETSKAAVERERTGDMGRPIRKT